MKSCCPHPLPENQLLLKKSKTVTLQCKILTMTLFSCKQEHTSGSNIAKTFLWWNSCCNEHKDYYKSKCSKALVCNSALLGEQSAEDCCRQTEPHRKMQLQEQSPGAIASSHQRLQIRSLELRKLRPQIVQNSS